MPSHIYLSKLYDYITSNQITIIANEYLDRYVIYAIYVLMG